MGGATVRRAPASAVAFLVTLRVPARRIHPLVGWQRAHALCRFPRGRDRPSGSCLGSSEGQPGRLSPYRTAGGFRLWRENGQAPFDRRLRALGCSFRRVASRGPVEGLSVGFLARPPLARLAAHARRSMSICNRCLLLECLTDGSRDSSSPRAPPAFTTGVSRGRGWFTPHAPTSADRYARAGAFSSPRRATDRASGAPSRAA